MAPANDNSPEVLREEILAEARRQAEQLVNRARQAAEALSAKVAAEAEKTLQERLDAARAEAARRKELVLSTVPVEIGRRRSSRIEALLQSIHDEARQRLLTRDGVEYRETVIVLAVDAVSRMAGDSFVVKLSPADRVALGTGLGEEIVRRVGRSPLTVTISEEPTITDGGLIIQDAEGRQVWDNRLLARLERLWPELRQQVAVQTGLVSGSESAAGSA